MKKTLLIMAAGLGSRYGGNKQVDRIGPYGDILMAYSIHDALAAGFDKVVFVIKREMEEVVRNLVGDRLAGRAEVVYAYQEYASLPDGFVPPEGRTKPYGTVHAVLSAKAALTEPFAVINADDFYGREGFAAMAASLESMRQADGGQGRAASMVAYDLRNTVSENGAVTRGICERDADSHLVSVRETYQIKPAPDGTIRDYATDPNGVILDPDALVSMNFWGFTPWVLREGEKRLSAFLRSADGDPMKKEYVLPTLVDQLMREDGLVVDVMNTHATWFGVTYQEDRPYVAAELKKLHEAGVYPEKL